MAAIVLGKTGKNFGAGMSGGIAYVYDEEGTFASRFNADSADLDPLDTEDQEWLTAMLRRHIELTASQRAEAFSVLATLPRYSPGSTSALFNPKTSIP